ncbi:MAG: cyclopropane-fatty-acyl-phospholipid synthase family protein [Pseudomonadota bacterium]|nr:cyclopropane-fatty-acyl-phospholipid synthase family protein [Pseudomonadota bacterium]
MAVMDALLEQKLSSLTLPLALVFPGGQRIGPADAAVTLRLKDLKPLASIVSGQIGKIGQDYVEGRLDFDGSMRDLMAIGWQLIGDDPTRPDNPAPLEWWRHIVHHAKSRTRHEKSVDAQQIQFHYDVSDEFYALWLDPARLYSCAYYASPGLALAQAQEAKLDHICKKLMLRRGERFLDIGAGWGGLLLWAAEHYGVQAHGITLSKNQHAHVSQLIDQRGLRGRVTMALLDYRDLPESEPYDKIASVGMFEHVGSANMPMYFAKIRQLLKPGGLLMNHGITSGGTRNHKLGAGLGDFIGRYIFPGGELMHVSAVLRMMGEARLEPLDMENLRPHYGRTLWAWSDALEARLAEARKVTSESVVRAYRLYLAGSAMCFQHGWLSLSQMLASRPTGDAADGPMRGAQSQFPFNRSYMYTQG